MVPFRERLTCSIADAVEATSISGAQLYRMIEFGGGTPVFAPPRHRALLSVGFPALRGISDRHPREPRGWGDGGRDCRFSHGGDHDEQHDL
jgi:hypothetical protein